MYEALARDLVALEVETAFGLMGDDTAQLVTALRAHGVTYHGARHENTAVAMAHGYAATTGRLGVCMISRGPGLTNGLTAAVDASKAHARVLIILGDVRASAVSNRPGPDYKALDSAATNAAVGLQAFAPRTAPAVRTALRDAVEHALRGNTVTLNVPIDLVDVPVDPDELPPARLPDVAPRPEAADPAAIGSAVALLEQSRKPLILAGRGAHRSGARDALLELAEHLGALVGTTLGAKDMFRGHAYDIGVVGTQSHAVARDLASQADTVLVFGAGVNQFTAGLGTAFASARILHVDAVRSHIGRWWRADVAVVGDAQVVARQLMDALPAREAERPFHAHEALQRLASFEHMDWLEPVASPWTIDPRSLMIELDAVLPKDRLVASDVGNFFGFIGPYLSVPGPDRFHYCFDFSAIGLGFGLALGAAAGRPAPSTVMIVGDGSLLMTLGELETVVRCDLPLIIVVMNDAAYGAERHFLELHGMSGAGATFPDVDFVDVAAGFGIPGVAVRSVEDVRGLAPLLDGNQGPLLIDCKVNQNVRDPVFEELSAGVASETHEPSDTASTARSA